MTVHQLGEAATQALILAAERWPEFREFQAILGPQVSSYQRWKIAGAEVGAALNSSGHEVCAVHMQYEPCPTCKKYEAAGL